MALLLAIAALVKERRLRFTLQLILQRLIDGWRKHAQMPMDRTRFRHDVDLDDDRV